jgi:hypothetical protein
MDDNHLSNITKLTKQLQLPRHLGYKQNLRKQTQNQTGSWWWKKIPKAHNIHGCVHT